jgi:hypothetical protein
LFDGQSLNIWPLAVGAADSYPEQLMRTLGKRSWWVIAVGGKSWTVLTSGDAEVAPATTRYRARTGPQPIIAVLNGGQSDVLPTGWGENQTGASAYADLIAYCNLIRSLGVDYIIVETLSPSTVWGSQEAQRLAYNSLVMAGNPAYNAVVDIANVVGLTNASNTAVYFDGLHWTALGAQRAADAVRPAVITAIQSFGGTA